MYLRRVVGRGEWLCIWGWWWGEEIGCVFEDGGGEGSVCVSGDGGGEGRLVVSGWREGKICCISREGSGGGEDLLCIT